MTIDSEQVLAHFVQLSGLTQDEARQWQPLCSGAANWVQGQLRRGVSTQQNQQALALAAAGVANYQFVLTTGGLPALKLGELQVGAENSNAAKQAAALRNQLLEQAAHCLTPQNAPALLGVQP